MTDAAGVDVEQAETNARQYVEAHHPELEVALERGDPDRVLVHVPEDALATDAERATLTGGNLHAMLTAFGLAYGGGRPVFRVDDVPEVFDADVSPRDSIRFYRVADEGVCSRPAEDVAADAGGDS